MILTIPDTRYGVMTLKISEELDFNVRSTGETSVKVTMYSPALFNNSRDIDYSFETKEEKEKSLININEQIIDYNKPPEIEKKMI